METLVEAILEMHSMGEMSEDQFMNIYLNFKFYVRIPLRSATLLDQL